MRFFVSHRSATLVFGSAFLLAVLVLAGCSPAPDPWKQAKEGQKRILTTFVPLYCLTHAIAGDDAYVACLLTAEGPHEYEFSPTDGVKARKADLLIYNGLGLDDKFVKRISASQPANTTLSMLNVGGTLPESLLRDMGEEDEHDHQDHKDHKDHKHDGHHHEAFDPHVWLGPEQAMAMVDAIAKKMADVDFNHKDGYAKRAAQLTDELKKLHEYGKDKFKNKKNRRVLSMHDSFGYFADGFGLESAGSIQAQPNVNPDAARLSELAQRCRKKNVGAITYEPQYSKAQAELLQQQLTKLGLDVRLAEFDPIETAEGKDGNPDPKIYLETMRANIDKLDKALP
jgi:ABC-type Zn uptake system ZnuABC Zn-binding protein ZnuA